MSKELEALQDLSKLVFIHGGVEQYKIIETALKRKEELERMHTNALEKIAKDRKKLKALEIIKAHPDQLLDIIDTDNYNEYLDLDYAPEQYLSEENYYELTPLEALKELVYEQENIKGSDVEEHLYHIIENALKEHELMKEIRITARFDLAQVNKEHKALEIIKEKKIDVALFDTIMKDKNQTDKLQSYNFWQFDKYKLTQEEFDLLKEVLL